MGRKSRAGEMGRGKKVRKPLPDNVQFLISNLRFCEMCNFLDELPCFLDDLSLEG